MSGSKPATIWLTPVMLTIFTYSVNANHFDEELVACLSVVLSRDFKERSMLVYEGRKTWPLLGRPLISEPDVDLSALLVTIEQNVGRSVEVSNYDHRPDSRPRYKRVKSQSSLFIVDGEMAKNWNEINLVFKKAKETEYWSKQGKTLILALNRNLTVSRDQIGRYLIGSHWMWNKAVNVVGMVVDMTGIYFYTWFPYRQPHCRIPALEGPYEIWQSGAFVKGTNLFPDKIKSDLEKCQLLALTEDCYPYTFEDDDGVRKGFEMALVQTLANLFNFTITFTSLPRGEDYQTTINANGSTAGAFGMLDRQEADIAFSCLMLTLERYNLAECLPTYFHDSLSWFIPTPDAKSHASNIFEAFPQQWWFAVFFTTIAAMMCFLFIIKVDDMLIQSGPPESLTGAVLRVFAMALSSPFTLSSKNVLLRAFTFIFAMYSLHITTVYQASLYNLYRSNSFINVYHSLEECVEKNLFVWLRASSKSMYEDDDDPLWANIMKPGHSAYLRGDPTYAFNQTAYHKSAVVLYIKSTMLGAIRELYLDEHRKPQIRYLPDQFASYPVTLFLSPGHPLTELMTITLQRIIASGSVTFWLNQVVQDDKRQEDALISDVSLKLEHIGGAFMFYAALITVSVGIFFIEVIYWLTHDRKSKLLMGKKEKYHRRQLIFRAVVDISKNHITRLKRIRSIPMRNQPNQRNEI